MMGEYADDAINRMLDKAMFESSYSHSPKRKPQPKARDLRRIAGRLQDLKKPTEEPKS